MSSLYFDIKSGISGDMTVAALLNLGISLEFLKKELKKINVGGYTIKQYPVARGHINALKFDCIVSSNRNYSYREIVRLVKSSRLSKNVKNNIIKIYDELCRAEIKVHGHKHHDIHFHQLGEIDTIVDVASVCICLEKLKIERLFYSLIPVGHGLAPVTLELLKNKDIYFSGWCFENVTPTGIALLSALGNQSSFGTEAVYKIKDCGYGAGSANPVEVDNYLRIAIVDDSYLETDEVVLIESNIDDMNPQCFEYVFERLFEAGALDVFISPIYMKKTRPGFLLTVLSKDENLGKITDIVFEETTTSGVRFDRKQRLKVPRMIKAIGYKGYKARVKVFGEKDCLRFAPEYDDCKALAKKLNIPILKVIDEIKRKAESAWLSQV